METYLKNNLILEEIKNNNLNDLEKIIEEIEGEITLEKIFKDLKINLYSTKKGKFYIELKRYIEKFTDNQCKEIKLLNNKFAIDKNKIKKLSEININNSYIFNKLTSSKKLIEINS
jgi:DNA-binding sugar fermentation-stimulating protein